MIHFDTFKKIFKRMHDLKCILTFSLVGLTMRLLILPFIMVADADAVARVSDAIRWLDRPKLIYCGIWLPLNKYLNAAAIWLYNDPIYAPVLLNILLSVATAIPLYFFAKNEFGKKVGLFTAYAYLFYPVVIRNSFMALSDIQFVFFVAVSLMFISYYRKGSQSWKYAAAAGLSLTLATMLRYEGWLLIPFLSGMFWKRPKCLVIFLMLALLFPTFWMVGNHIKHGDPLYGTNAAAKWEIEGEGRNDDLTIEEIVHRFIYFPSVILSGITPIVAAFSLSGIFLALYRRKKYAVWLIPLAGLCCLLLAKTVDGSLYWRARYSITIGALMLPYCAVAILTFFKERIAGFVMALVIIAMLPLSYLHDYVPYPLTRYIQADNKFLPRLDDKVLILSQAVNDQLEKNNKDALIFDFTGWAKRAYVAQMTGLHPDHIFLMPGGRHEKLKMSWFKNFLKGFNSGILILRETSRFSKSVRIEGNQLWIPQIPRPLTLQILQVLGDIVIYSYRYNLRPDTEGPFSSLEQIPGASEKHADNQPIINLHNSPISYVQKDRFVSEKKMYLPCKPDSSGSWEEIAGFINPNERDANICLSAYDVNGKFLEKTSLIRHPAKSQRMFLIDEALALSCKLNALVIAECDGTDVFGFCLFQYYNRTYAGLAVSALPSLSFTHGFLPIVKTSAHCRTELLIANPGAIAASVVLTGYDNTKVKALSRRIPAKGIVFENIEKLFGVGFDGYIDIVADSEIVGKAFIKEEGASISILNVMTADSASSELYGAFLVSMGSSYTTEIRIINAGLDEAAVTLSIYPPDGGSPLSSRLLTIPAHQIRTLSDGEIGIRTSDNTCGWLNASCTGAPVLGCVTIREIGILDIQTKIPMSGKASKDIYMAPALIGKKIGVSLFSGISIVNPNSVDSDVILSLFGEDGKLCRRIRFDLEPGAMYIRNLDQIGGGSKLPDSFAGYIHISSDRPVAACGLVGDEDGQFLYRMIPYSR